MVEESEFYELSLEAQFEAYFVHCHMEENSEKVAQFKELLAKVQATFPELVLEFRWYQPMFLLMNDKGDATFIASFTLAKNWINFAAENWTQTDKNTEITEKGYQHTAKFVQFPFKKGIDFDFISRMMTQQIKEKRGAKKFWKEQLK